MMDFREECNPDCCPKHSISKSPTEHSLTSSTMSSLLTLNVTLDENNGDLHCT
jgi:hypothetical protein